MSRSFVTSLALIVTTLTANHVLAGQFYTVTDLSALPGADFVNAYSINSSGEVTGEATNSSTNHQDVFLYDGTTIHDLGTLTGGKFSGAASINDSGQITGYSDIGNGTIHAILYDGTTIRDLGMLPGGTKSAGGGINASGQIAGYSTVSGGNTHAFLYDGTRMHDLGTLPGGNYSAGAAVNASGQVAGEATTAGGTKHAILYDGTTMHDLGTLPGGNQSFATSINLSGQVTGMAVLTGGETHAFLYDGTTMLDLGTLPGGSNSGGSSINDSGQVAGFSTISDGSSRATFYDGKVMWDLNSLIDPNSGYVLQVAEAVNNRGQIVANGTLSGQQTQHTLLLTPEYWTGAGSSSWADGGNWTGPAPGNTNGTTIIDVALFNESSPNSPLTIDAGRNVQNITFDTANVNSMTIGMVGGNALMMTAGGTIQTTATVVNPQTINAPLVLEGDYTFTSGASSSSATLSFGGGITPAATGGVTTLTLNGTNTGANTISDVLADNGAGQLAVTKSGAGVWILSGANTYSGNTTVLGGTLKFNITSGTPTIAAGVTATVGAGATLELAGSVSALGTAGGNRVHLVNNSTASGVVVSGTNQVVGNIDGSGTTQVNAGSDLTANHIVQSALLIGGTASNPALAIIAASDQSGNPLGEDFVQASGLNSSGSLVSNSQLDPSTISTGSTVGLAPTEMGGVSSIELSAASPSAVPEPSTMTLLSVAAVGLLALSLSRRASLYLARLHLR
jgi:probable HAF family extracellular repeat protein/autotransporter-associated beta strand protein